MSVRYTEVNHRHNTHNSLLFSAVFVVACPAHVRGRDGKRCLCGRFVAAAVAAACSTLARWLARWRCGYTLRCRGLRRCCATDGRALQARPTSWTRVWTDCQPIRCMWRPPRDDSLRHCSGAACTRREIAATWGLNRLHKMVLGSNFSLRKVKVTGRTCT